jgi:hypothetical protein
MSGLGLTQQHISDFLDIEDPADQPHTIRYEFHWANATNNALPAPAASSSAGWGPPVQHTTIDQAGNTVAKTPAAAAGDADRKVRVTWAGDGERSD